METNISISLSDEGQYLPFWAGQTQPAQPTLFEALKAAEQARLSPWWLPELDEFVPIPKHELERYRMVEPVMNEILPRYVIARYPARLQRYDHDLGGFPVVWRARTMSWGRIPPDPREPHKPCYIYRMIGGFDPVDLQVLRKGVPQEWGTPDALTAERLVWTLVKCSPEQGRVIRKRESEARLELVIAVPGRRESYVEIRAGAPFNRIIGLASYVYPIACADLVLDDIRYPLMAITNASLRPLVASSLPTLGFSATREEIQQFVEAEVQRRWMDLRTRCPRCKGTGKCGRCDGLGYILVICSKCEGDGQIEKKCELCNGTGRLGSGVQCYACFGGRHLYICPFCDDPRHGRGRERQRCSVCGGSGKCPDCQGSGRIPLE